MKKIIAMMMALMLCGTFAYAEDVVSDQHSENVEVVSPTPVPTEKPDWRVTISSSLDGVSSVMEGEEVTLTANMHGIRDVDSYTLVWQENRGDGWIDVGSGQTYRFRIDRTNVHYKWRVVAHITSE